MQIGTFLPTYWASYGTRTVAEAIVETAQAADTLGYASLWANDHVIAPADQASMGHIIEPLITLASVAALVPRLELGTSTLVLPQRHAVLVAKQVAALDALSGGRVTLGIGVGWLEKEFRMLDADFAHRGAVADEAIAVLRALWRAPRATFQGAYYQFADAVCAPKPTREVPIWMCGNTRTAIGRAWAGSPAPTRRWPPPTHRRTGMATTSGTGRPLACGGAGGGRTARAGRGVRAPLAHGGERVAVAQQRRHQAGE